MAQIALIEAYQVFMQTANSYLNIRNEKDYQGVLQILEEILETADDTEDDHLNPLIELVSKAIEEYESQDEELVAFLDEAESVRCIISSSNSVVVSLGGSLTDAYTFHAT